MFLNHQWLVLQRGSSPSLSLVLCTSAHKYEHFCKGDKVRRPASYKKVQAFAHHGSRVVQHAQNDSGTCAHWCPCFYVTYDIYTSSRTLWLSNQSMCANISDICTAVWSPDKKKLLHIMVLKSEYVVQICQASTHHSSQVQALSYNVKALAQNS